MPRCWIVCAVLKDEEREVEKTLCMWNVRLAKLLVHSSKPAMMNFLNRCVLIHARVHAYTLIQYATCVALVGWLVCARFHM